MGVGRLQLKEVFLDRMYQVSKERFVWIPSSVSGYLARVISSHFLEPFPNDLSALMEGLHRRIPADRVDRYSHLQKMGDLIVYFHEFWGIPSCVATRGHAQTYYDDAAAIGKRIHEPEAPVLEKLAEDLPDYEGVLRELRKVA